MLPSRVKTPRMTTLLAQPQFWYSAAHLPAQVKSVALLKRTDSRCVALGLGFSRLPENSKLVVTVCAGRPLDRRQRQGGTRGPGRLIDVGVGL